MDILTTEQAADMLQFSTVYTRTLAARGQIPAIQMGDDWRFVKQQLLEHLSNRAAREQQHRKQAFDQQQSAPIDTTKIKRRGRPRKHHIG